jgi:hypothetical protein
MEDQTNYAGLQSPDGGYADSTNAASPYSNKNSATKATAAKAAGKVPVNGEVTVLAFFDWQPAIDGKTEIDYLIHGKWHPSYEDFKVIAGPTSVAPGNFTALLGMIAEFAPKSIKRLNFFTHANSHLIGITGYMDAADVYFTTSVSDVDISNNTVNTFTYTYLKNTFELKDVRERFSDDAIFVLYGCRAGFDPTTLLTAMHDLLNVTVIGFKEKIVFCPPSQDLSSNVFKRNGEKIGIYKKGFSCSTDATADWRSLINDPNAVKIPK